MHPIDARMIWLGAAAVPYFTLAGVDAWMHEKARRVPLREQLLHGGIAITLALFFVGAFVMRGAGCTWGLLAFSICYAFDEFGFHRGIAQGERRVHAAAIFALLYFVLVWQGLRS